MESGAAPLHPPQRSRMLRPSRTAAPFGSDAPPRTGVTLFELLLVLVLLVIAGSLAIPAISGAFASVRLRRAGDAILAHWAQARARAVESGLPYQFTFTPETGDFRLEPWDGAPLDDRRATSRPASASSGQAASTSASAGTSLEDSAVVAATLPEPIVFQGGQRATVDPLSGAERVDALRTVGAKTSTPVLFFPDGSASQATVVLQNDQSQYVRLTIRGLTGVARASAVLTREEMDAGAETR